MVVVKSWTLVPSAAIIPTITPKVIGATPGAFGTGPFGTGVFGGPGTISIARVFPVARNAIQVTFNQVPRADDVEGFDSAINPLNWALITVDPTITATNGDEVVLEGEVVPIIFPSVVGGSVPDDELDPCTIELVTDLALERRVRYVLQALRIVGEDGGTLYGSDQCPLRGLGFKQQNRERQPLEPYRDLDTLGGKTPGAFAFEPTTDVAVHGGGPSLRKRIHRRIMTAPGGFVHLPKYGAGVRAKAQGRPDRIQDLASDLALQIQQEPDVQTASVEVEMLPATGGANPTGVVLVSVRVTQVDNTNRVFSYELPQEPT